MSQSSPSTPFTEVLSSPFQSIVELRRYRLHPDRREDLIDLFEREFIESQETCGMSVLGQFRDLDRPDDFVWLRGFAGMQQRAEALAAFYDGPVWSAHKDAANATMECSDDVHLLRPCGPGFDFVGATRPGLSEQAPPNLLAITIISLKETKVNDFAELFDSTYNPLLVQAGASPLGTFATLDMPNNYPRLPVRTDRAFIWINRFENAERHEAFRSALSRSGFWSLLGASRAKGASAIEATELRLEPTARSLLR
ncbi:NIPSNAP family protein [Nitratireductor luteus]|uniref:NIPSNAP family protein n=1 Tax=Nitratireductor luteus TaxID=2976980 RepID=UPI0022401445|nr:NIPSNAP family protein [Nitratireductor luteus]